MDHWLAVAAFTAEHHGLVDRAELNRIGVRKPDLERWVAASRLARCAPRVWRLVGAPVSWEQRLMTGLMTLGPSAAVSHCAAAALHGFDHFEPGPVQFLVPPGKRGSRFDGDVRSSASIGRGDTVTVNGLRVTSATRTIVDLVCEVDGEDLAAAIDSAVRLRISAPAAIERRIRELRGPRRHAAYLVESVLRESGGESMLERRFLELVHEHHLPEPEPQVVFRAGRRTIARVDFYWPDHRLVVEVSGQLGHSTPRELGLDVFEFTFAQVMDEPAVVIRAVRRRLSPLAAVPA
jgi:hypothetical protein